MQTFKQYMVDEMGGSLSAGFRSVRTGEYDDRIAQRKLKPLIHDANRLLRRKDRMNPEQLKTRARDMLNQFVDSYDSLGDEATELKAQIADKYTQIKQMLQDDQHTVEDCVQMLEQVCDLLHG